MPRERRGEPVIATLPAQIDAASQDRGYDQLYAAAASSLSRGALRPGKQAQALSGSACAAGAAAPKHRPGRRRRRAVAAAYLLPAAALFAAYVRLSQTSALNSDGANILLMGWSLLHGNLLLHGWYMSDVSFYPTELPQYALLESLLGLRALTAHVAAAMTYTLALLFAVMLARAGSSGRQALVRTLIAAGIMLAPQLGPGVFDMDLSVGHIGTAVPLLLIWLLLDRADRSARRWYVPVLAAVLLAWVQVADRIVYIAGIGPLALVAAARVIQGWIRARGSWPDRIASQWYDLSLGAAAVAAAGLAWIADKVLGDLGGYTVARLPFHLTPWSGLHGNWPAAWKVLEVFGANFAGLSGIPLALAVLHLASLILVAAALVRLAWRFSGASLVDQVLAVAIVLNAGLYLLTTASHLAAHEVAIIAPFGAALTARTLVRAKDRGSAGPRVRRLRQVGLAAGILVLAGYAAGLGYELTQPTLPAANTSLAAWLAGHHLTYGLSGYWTSSSVTLDSGNHVQVRALMPFTMKPYLWMSDQAWYDPKTHDANFIVLDSQPGGFSYWEPRALIRKYFGSPARIYQTGPYTVLVWDRNLLPSMPGNPG
jgi:hypothetical protein